MNVENKDLTIGGRGRGNVLARDSDEPIKNMDSNHVTKTAWISCPLGVKLFTDYYEYYQWYQ